MWSNECSVTLIKCFVFIIIFGYIRSTHCAIISGFFTDIDFVGDWRNYANVNVVGETNVQFQFHYNGKSFPSHEDQNQVYGNHFLPRIYLTLLKFLTLV